MTELKKIEQIRRRHRDKSVIIVSSVIDMADVDLVTRKRISFFDPCENQVWMSRSEVVIICSDVSGLDRRKVLSCCEHGEIVFTLVYNGEGYGHHVLGVEKLKDKSENLVPMETVRRMEFSGQQRTLSSIDNVYVNGPATIIKWKDGGKTVVKASNLDTIDSEKGFLVAYFQGVTGLSKKKYSTLMKSLPESKIKKEVKPKEDMEMKKMLSENKMDEIRRNEIGVVVAKMQIANAFMPDYKPGKKAAENLIYNVVAFAYRMNEARLRYLENTIDYSDAKALDTLTRIQSVKIDAMQKIAAKAKDLYDGDVRLEKMSSGELMASIFYILLYQHPELEWEYMKEVGTALAE